MHLHAKTAMKSQLMIAAVIAGVALLCHGAEVRDNFGSRSSVDAAGGTISKGNADGYTVWRSDATPVEDGKAYAGTAKVEVLSRMPGAAMSVRLVMLDSDLCVSGVAAENAAIHQALFSCGTFEFLREAPAGHGAAFMRMEVVLAGNPATVRILDHGIANRNPETLPAGVYAPKAPPPDRERTLAQLEKVTPATARVVRKDNGRLALLLDGRETLLKSYKGSIDYRELAGAGINLIQSFNAGITLFWDKMPWDMAAMRPDGSFDFSRLENELIHIHAAAPDARVLLNVNLDVGKHFFDRHPDSIFRNERGELGIRQFVAFAGFGVEGPNPAKNRHYAVSYASEEYQQYVCRGLRELAQFLRTSAAGRIVAGFGFNGGHDDQLFQWEYSAWRGQGDYSPAGLAAYRRYLKDKYATDAALQKAWEDPAAAIAHAPLFSEKQWQSSPYWSDGAAGLARRIADGRAFMSDAIADMNNRFARTLKDAMGRDVVVGTYYSSPLWGQAGRSSLRRLGGKGGIDMVFQVSGYSSMRKLGGSGASANFTIAAAHQAGLLYLQEMDHRTPRSQVTAGWTLESLAYPRDFDDFKNQILRDAGAVLACGGDGFFYFDMFDSWYNDPRALDAIAATSRAADWSLKYRDRDQPPKAAMFVDERSRLLDRDSLGFAGRAAITARFSGITPALHLLDDLGDGNLPDYQLYIVVHPQSLSAAQLQALVRKALQPGKVLLVTGAAGALSNPQAGQITPALDALGVKTKTSLSTIADSTVFVDGSGDAIAAGCSGRLGMADLFITGERFPQCETLRYWAAIDDPSAAILGRWSASGLPALGVKRLDNGAVIIYSASPDGLTPQLIANAAKAAGITPLAAPGNVVTAGNGVVAIHRTDAPVRLTFPRKVELFDLESRQPLGSDTVFDIDCPPLSSRLLGYR